MAEHKYAQVLRWIADGKDVQCLSSDVNVYKDVKHQSVLHAIGNDCAVQPDSFRLKPRAIMIGDVECEAPVLEPEEGQLLYWCSMDGDVNRAHHFGKTEASWWLNLIKSGRAFASADAARAAHDAIIKILTQGAAK